VSGLLAEITNENKNEFIGRSDGSTPAPGLNQLRPCKGEQLILPRVRKYSATPHYEEGVESRAGSPDLLPAGDAQWNLVRAANPCRVPTQRRIVVSNKRNTNIAVKTLNMGTEQGAGRGRTLCIVAVNEAKGIQEREKKIKDAAITPLSAIQPVHKN